MDRLSFQDVSHAYVAAKGRVAAVRGLSFSVGEGESVAIIGPSGCGKSTALRMAAGLLRPDGGTVLVNGGPILRPRRETAFVPQDFGLLPWKTAGKNVELGLGLRGVPAMQRSQRAAQALGMVGLQGFQDAYPSELSGGMRQRLAIARALALEVDLLLLDEPLSALDALLREQLQDLLLALWKEQGYAQLLVTHSIEEAAYLGQRILVMAPRPGRVVACVENPGAGDASYRQSAAFFDCCTRLRRLLRDAAGEAACEATGAAPAEGEASHA